LASLEGHTGWDNLATFSPDGKRVLTTSSARTATVWDAATGARLRTLEGHTGSVRSAAFSPDGKRIATASGDGTAAVWDAATGARLASLKGHNASVISVAFSPDGKRVVTASEDDTAAVWDAATGARVASLKGHTAWARSALFSPDGKRIVTASDDHTAAVWDAATGARVASLEGHIRAAHSATYSADGQRVVLTSADKTATVWDVASGARLASLKGHSAWLSAAAFSPDGKRVVTASADGTVAVWGTATGARLLSIKGHTRPVHSVAFSPDGKRLVTASADHTALVWDAATGARLVSLEGHTDTVFSAAFSPDGKRVVTASEDHTARAWDAVTGARLASFEGHTDTVSSAAFSPDGKHVVTASADNRAVVWDAATGARLLSLVGHTDRAWSAVFSPDGKRVLTASGDRTAALWDAATGDRLASFRGHTDSVYSAALSPDGKRVVTASADGTARLWDVGTGDELCRLLSLAAGADWLVATPEGLFDGSLGGRQKVSYRVGKGLTVVPVDRFFQDFARPGLLAFLARGERPLPGADFARQRPPLVRIISPKAGTAARPEVALEAEATDQGGGVQGPWLYHNGAPVLAPGKAERAGKTIRRRFHCSLVQGENKLEVRAASGDGSWYSEPAALLLRYERPLPRAELYLVAVGAGKYAQPAYNLKFAAADARAFADLFRKRGKALYHKAHVTLLLDEKATSAGIARAFADLKGKARPQDTLVVFLAGHGTVVGQRYYFIPHDFKASGGPLEADVRKQGLPHDLLADHVNAVGARRQVLVLDTCASGGAAGLVRTARNPFALRGAAERLARNEGIHLIAAASANEEAKEIKELGHGLLTYALLAGLKAVDRGPLEEKWVRPASPEGVIDVAEWFGFAAGHVPQLARRYFGSEQEVVPQTTGLSFPVLPLHDPK
jgi:WD40 repeat protein